MQGPQRHLEREQRKAGTDLSLDPCVEREEVSRTRQPRGLGGVCKESGQH